MTDTLQKENESGQKSRPYKTKEGYPIYYYEQIHGGGKDENGKPIEEKEDSFGFGEAYQMMALMSGAASFFTK